MKELSLFEQPQDAIVLAHLHTTPEKFIRFLWKRYVTSQPLRFLTDKGFFDAHLYQSTDVESNPRYYIRGKFYPRDRNNSEFNVNLISIEIEDMERAEDEIRVGFFVGAPDVIAVCNWLDWLISEITTNYPECSIQSKVETMSVQKHQLQSTPEPKDEQQARESKQSEYERLKNELKQRGDRAEVELKVVLEALRNDGLMPKDLTAEESQIFIDEVGALTQTTPKPQDDDSYITELYRLVYQAWCNVQKHLKEANTIAKQQPQDRLESAISDLVDMADSGASQAAQYLLGPNSIMREYLITEYEENFINFSNHFGRTKQGGAFRSHDIGDGRFSRKKYLSHRVNLNREDIATISIILEIQGDGQLKVIAVMSPITPANPLTAPALKYLAELDEAIQKKYQPLAQHLQDDGLTGREKEVAGYLSQNLSDEQIAEKLVIAVGTVKKHRQHIAKKWDMSTQDLKAMQDEAKRRRYPRG